MAWLCKPANDSCCFDDNGAALPILYQQINPIEPVVAVLLVGCAFQQRYHLDVIIQQCGEKALEYNEIGLIA